VIYNASVVNFYNATGSIARFENKNILFYFEKRSSLVVNSKNVGLAPALNVKYYSFFTALAL
jgi:hypothetical protein